MNYNVAKKKAISLNPKVNACKEYKDAFMFYEKTDKEIDGAPEIVILKENGKAITFVQFILNYKVERTPREIEF